MHMHIRLCVEFECMCATVCVCVCVRACVRVFVRTVSVCVSHVQVKLLDRKRTVHTYSHIAHCTKLLPAIVLALRYLWQAALIL